MGGSILGAKAIYNFLQPKLKKFQFIDNFSEYGRGRQAFRNAMDGIKQHSPVEDVKHYHGESVLESINRINPYKNELDKLQSAIARMNGERDSRVFDRTERFREAYMLYNKLVSEIQKKEAPDEYRFDEAQDHIGEMSIDQASNKAWEMIRGRNPLAYSRKTRPTEKQLKEDMSKFKRLNPEWHDETWGVLYNFQDFYKYIRPTADGIFLKPNIDKVPIPKKNPNPPRRSLLEPPSGAVPRI